MTEEIRRTDASDASGSGRRGWALLLLLVPFVGTLYPDWYSRVQPALEGIPFFIWYQFAMVLAGVLVTMAVYLLQWGTRDWRS